MDMDTLMIPMKRTPKETHILTLQVRTMYAGRVCSVECPFYASIQSCRLFGELKWDRGDTYCAESCLDCRTETIMEEVE